MHFRSILTIFAPISPFFSDFIKDFYFLDFFAILLDFMRFRVYHIKAENFFECVVKILGSSDIPNPRSRFSTTYCRIAELCRVI